MSLFSKLFQYVLTTSNKYKIDESHGLSHAMDIFMRSNQIYEAELIAHPQLKSQEKIIYVSAILHDMCDKKYMNQDEGIANIEQFLTQIEPYHKMRHEEIEVVKNIIDTMSYSYVKQNGMPDLGEYQCAYNIVREADLLCAYDFDRCMIYHMNKIGNGNIIRAFDDSVALFKTRIFNHEKDGLFFTTYAKDNSHDMQQTSISRINHWREMLTKQI